MFLAGTLSCIKAQRHHSIREGGVLGNGVPQLLHLKGELYHQRAPAKLPEVGVLRATQACSSLNRSPLPGTQPVWGSVWSLNSGEGFGHQVHLSGPQFTPL